MKIRFIGKIVNQLRTENNISIEELSKRSGVTADKIKIIESGEAIPSLTTMIKLSHALGARLGALLDGADEASAVVTRAAEVEINSQQMLSGDNEKSRQLEFFSLARGIKDRAMEPMIVELEAGQGQVDVASDHEGEEFIYVLDGSIEVNYGDKTYTLAQGDSIYYNSTIPHSLHSSSTAPARVLAVIYTP